MATSHYALALALLRVVTGFIVWQHGAQTFAGMLGGAAAATGTLQWFVGGAECFGGIAIGVGMFTRPVALFVAADMAVLYLTTYLPLGFPPIVTRPGEVACLLVNINLLLAFTGPGRWSVDGDSGADRAADGWRTSLRGLSRYMPTALGVIRVLMGLLLVSYGLRKMFGMLGADAEPLLSLQWYAGIVELVGGAGIVAGLFTKPTAFLCCGQMAFAYFINHNPRGFFPIQNGGERAALFCYFFLLLWTIGPGRWSLDGPLHRRRSARGRV